MKITKSQLTAVIKSVVQECINERKEHWIQKAVNPDHKGACTPMSKASCTPARKALAKRFKSGDIHHDNVAEAGLTSEGDVSREPNEEESNYGAQYSVRDGSTQCEQPGKLNRARQIQKNPAVNEGDVSTEPNEEESNYGAQYSVRDGSTNCEQPGKLNRARQIQKNPAVNEGSSAAILPQLVAVVKAAYKVNKAGQGTGLEQAQAELSAEFQKLLAINPDVVKEAAFKKQAHSYKTQDQQPQYPEAIADPENP